jgi:two-component system, LytTR family, sensor histidine kinase AlgZ
VGRIVRILAINTFAAAMYALLLSSLVGWASAFRYFLVSLIYANVIGTAAHLLMPVVGARLSRRASAVYWLGLAATLFGLTLVGSVVAGTFAAALGLFGSSSVWAAQRAGIGIALVLAMTVGMGVAVYESMRARLDEARESLRARELEIERAHRLATDARLASLESRLHPHFLFNALAAIAGQVREAPERAERLLVEFADLLRASLDATKRHTVPLGDEVSVVQSYLEIEHARLGERLRTKLDVPDELRAWPVPPLALHTLVQNSIKHVAAARPGGAEVRIEARRVADRLAVSVWDDGPGFDLAEAPTGHGLETLRARLGVLFGPGAVLEAARDAEGARITMSLPAHVVIAERS